MGVRKNCIMRSFIICAFEVLLRWSNQGRWDRIGCMKNKWNAYRCFVGIAQGKGLSGISRFRIDINVKIDIEQPGS
jgi:hypothetical protein